MLTVNVVLRTRTVLSRRQDLQKPDLIGVLSALLRGEAQIVGGVLEPAYNRPAGDVGGLALPESVPGFKVKIILLSNRTALR